MTFDEWLEMGRELGFCGPLYCVRHEMPAKEDLPAGDDGNMCVMAHIVFEHRFIP